MFAISRIADHLYTISGWFYDLYLEAYYTFWMPTPITTGFYLISSGFNYLGDNFSDFDIWVRYVTEQISLWKILELIPIFFKDFFDAAINAWAWVNDARNNVLAFVNTWWASKISDVQGWIAIATQGFASLRVAWEDFRGKIPSIEEIIFWFRSWYGSVWGTITDWYNDHLWVWELYRDDAVRKADKLIKDTLLIWFPFYDDLAQLWGSIAEFFSDPEDWLYKSADRIVERFW